MMPSQTRTTTTTMARWYLIVLFGTFLLAPGPSLAAADTASSGTPASKDVYDFERMSSLIKRLDVLEKAAPDTMMGFYEPRLRSFSIKPESLASRKRVCITSTCYALLTLVLSSGVYDSLISFSEDDTSIDKEKDSSTDSKIPVRQVMRALLAPKLREDDLFQVPLLIYTLLRVDTDRSLIRSVASDAQTALRIRKLISAVLKACPKEGRRQLHSAYITYQICKVIALLQETTEIPLSPKQSQESEEEEDSENATETGVGGLPTNTLPDGVASEIFWALLSCAEVSSNELCRQLAFRAAGDSNSFDVIRLAYSLLTYIRSTEGLSGLAGKEVVRGQGPPPETKVAPLNRRLVKAALAAYFQEQNHDGLWDKGQPIFLSFAQGKGRNMGNAFVFSVNTVGSLLCALPPEYFRPHLGALERTLGWIESHQTVEMITDYCDAKTGQCYGKPLRGWSSPHSTPGAGPQAWPTAQVLKCVSWMKHAVRQLMHKDVLEEFNGIAFSKSGIQTAGWDQLLDTDIGDPSKEDCRTIKSVLEERVAIPFADSIDNPSYGAAYSAILFGPPGTAKTTICEALAQRLGWDFLVIDTSAFLADGLSNVAARIRYVFTRLMALRKAIILFDEIEEFALDRETPGLSMESRMLTTAMLTAINDLRRNQQSIFFVATNRLRAFDSAITRPGRFDMQLFVGTPNLDSRVVQLQQKLSGKVNDQIKSRALESYRHFLESVWTQEAMFMNYLEGMQFATACADLVLSGSELSSEQLSAILKQQAAVMTVRGTAREEYIACMELSRL